jgi:hypothetical protein
MAEDHNFWRCQVEIVHTPPLPQLLCNDFERRRRTVLPVPPSPDDTLPKVGNDHSESDPGLALTKTRLNMSLYTPLRALFGGGGKGGTVLTEVNRDTSPFLFSTHSLPVVFPIRRLLRCKWLQCWRPPNVDLTRIVTSSPQRLSRYAHCSNFLLEASESHFLPPPPPSALPLEGGNGALAHAPGFSSVVSPPRFSGPGSDQL